jgi:hypothetical protein
MSADLLLPAGTPEIADRVRIDDGDALAADLIRVEFMSETFDRSRGESAERNRIIDIGFAVVNEWLLAFRIAATAAIVKSVQRLFTSWRIDYLNDEGGALASQEGLARQMAGIAFQIPARVVLTPDAWTALATVAPGYEASRWDQLIVDAGGLFPEVGPAILLAYTAVEIRVASAADVLARERGVDKDLWEWFTRKRPYIVQPETEEYAKTILRALGGRSLADDDPLWTIFVRLRKARNSFAHEGIARDLDTKNPLTLGQAAQLVGGARRILDWIDTLLPPQDRAKRAALPDVKIETIGDVLKT